jgi:hypothetical protein
LLDVPIRRENLGRYPPAWREISWRIRFVRAESRCECTGECGTDHAKENAAYYNEGAPTDAVDKRCIAKHGERHPVTQSRVVLTTAHLDHTPENCGDDNLKAMCQKCHNQYDMPMRRRGIRKRLRALLAVGDLFG